MRMTLQPLSSAPRLRRWENDFMNLKLILLPLVLPVELASVVITTVATLGANPSECGFGNWVFDRKLGNPVGKTWQTREQALEKVGK